MGLRNRGLGLAMGTLRETKITIDTRVVEGIPVGCAGADGVCEMEHGCYEDEKRLHFV